MAKICDLNSSVLQNLCLSELHKKPLISLSEYRTWSELNNKHEILGDGQNLAHNVPNSSNCLVPIVLRAHRIPAQTHVPEMSCWAI